MMTSTTKPTLRFDEGSMVVPGDRLGALRQVRAGKGTYIKAGNVYASLVGKLTIEPVQDNNDAASSSAPQFHAHVDSTKEILSLQVLSVADVVLGRITRITNTQAFVDIFAKDTIGTLRYPSEGIIRREDIRPLASEQLPVEDNFLPNDLVLCRILATGDQRRYLLTSAAPELGVIHAVSATSGNPMVPVSWKEMTCPHSGVREPRKCARPRQTAESI